jgi:hypothetical protein
MPAHTPPYHTHTPTHTHTHTHAHAHTRRYKPREDRPRKLGSELYKDSKYLMADTVNSLLPEGVQLSQADLHERFGTGHNVLTGDEIALRGLADTVRPPPPT